LAGTDAGRADGPDPESVLAFLARRRNVLDGVVVSGGEPTCQDPSRLGAFLDRLKSLGYKVKLDTNGSRPRVLAPLLEAGLVDYLAVDIKSVPGRYHPALADPAVSAPVAETVELVRSRGRAAEFRTTCLNPFVDKGLIVEMARAIRGPIPLFLQAYRPGLVLDPDFMARQGPQPGPADLLEMAALASAFSPCAVR
jgi:pyruvate formate lyase activating enzyme